MIVGQKVSEVQDSIDRNPFLNSNSIQVLHQDGKFLLCGEVTSFFEKQMAQEALKQIDAFAVIENALEVYDQCDERPQG